MQCQEPQLSSQETPNSPFDWRGVRFYMSINKEWKKRREISISDYTIDFIVLGTWPSEQAPL